MVPAMDLLIVRHGQAVEDAPGLGDGGRWLTAKGRKVTRRVARWLAKRKDRRPAAIWTSPLVRAVQTAEILAETMGLDGDVSVVAELCPGRDASELIRLLSLYRGPEPLALVGHEPLLSALSTDLLGGAAWSGASAGAGGEARPRLKKSGVLSLRWDGRGSASLRFVLDPKEMSVVTGSGPAGVAEDPG
jgi:phosphohistidine phosphatase